VVKQTIAAYVRDDVIFHYAKVNTNHCCVIEVKTFFRRDCYAICGGFLRNFDTAQFAVSGNFNKAKILLFTYANASLETFDPARNKNPVHFQQTPYQCVNQYARTV
jgi:hypothetical protein